MSGTAHYADGRVEVTRLVVGPLDNNVFIVRCLRTGEAVLIDAANEAPRLLEAAAALGAGTVLTTHGHHDHIGAVPAMRSAGHLVGVTAADAPKLPGYDFIIGDGDVIRAGDVRLTAITTPGHTAGSVCFHVGGSPLLFTGDTLFPGGPGATRSPDSSFETIVESVRGLFERFDDETLILPGHGSDTTIGGERPHLQEWIDRGW